MPRNEGPSIGGAPRQFCVPWRAEWPSRELSQIAVVRDTIISDGKAGTLKIFSQ
jgi:hypothetical protein